MDSAKQEKLFTRTPFQVTNQIIKKKSILELRKNLSKDAYKTTISFRNEFYENDTELSKELWQIKMKNYTSKITWIIIWKCLPYNYNSRKCYLCLNEKLEIVLYEGENLIRKRNLFPNVVIKTSSCYCVMIPRAENWRHL